MYTGWNSDRKPARFFLCQDTVIFGKRNHQHRRACHIYADEHCWSEHSGLHEYACNSLANLPRLVMSPLLHGAMLVPSCFAAMPPCHYVCRGTVATILPLRSFGLGIPWSPPAYIYTFRTMLLRSPPTPIWLSRISPMLYIAPCLCGRIYTVMYVRVHEWRFCLRACVTFINSQDTPPAYTTVAAAMQACLGVVTFTRLFVCLFVCLCLGNISMLVSIC